MVPMVDGSMALHTFAAVVLISCRVVHLCVMPELWPQSQVVGEHCWWPLFAVGARGALLSPLFCPRVVPSCTRWVVGAKSLFGCTHKHTNNYTFALNTTAPHAARAAGASPQAPSGDNWRVSNFFFTVFGSDKWHSGMTTRWHDDNDSTQLCLCGWTGSPSRQ